MRDTMIQSFDKNRFVNFPMHARVKVISMQSVKVQKFPSITKSSSIVFVAKRST